MGGAIERAGFDFAFASDRTTISGPGVRMRFDRTKPVRRLLLGPVARSRAGNQRPKSYFLRSMATLKRFAPTVQCLVGTCHDGLWAARLKQVRQA